MSNLCKITPSSHSLRAFLRRGNDPLVLQENSVLEASVGVILKCIFCRMRQQEQHPPPPCPPLFPSRSGLWGCLHSTGASHVESAKGCGTSIDVTAKNRGMTPESISDIAVLWKIGEDCGQSSSQRQLLAHVTQRTGKHAALPPGSCSPLHSPLTLSLLSSEIGRISQHCNQREGVTPLWTLGMSR